MRQVNNYGDERQIAQCAYCAGNTLTRDHVPSRVLLDKPYPENLPVVPACLDCNQGFSSDEEYLACLVDCVIADSCSPEDVGREKIRRILSRKPNLAALLASSRRLTNGTSHFLVHDHRVRSVVLKLGRGHALFELNEPQFDEPHSVVYTPLLTLSGDVRASFEHVPKPAIWPEVGSRAMMRLESVDGGYPQWIVVQPGRYRHLAFVDDAVVVRVVLSEYLACEITWRDA